MDSPLEAASARTTLSPSALSKRAQIAMSCEHVGLRRRLTQRDADGAIDVALHLRFEVGPTSSRHLTLDDLSPAVGCARRGAPLAGSHCVVDIGADWGSTIWVAPVCFGGHLVPGFRADGARRRSGRSGSRPARISGAAWQDHDQPHDDNPESHLPSLAPAAGGGLRGAGELAVPPTRSGAARGTSRISS
jgi:hypothetical protein